MLWVEKGLKVLPLGSVNFAWLPPSFSTWMSQLVQWSCRKMVLNWKFMLGKFTVSIDMAMHGMKELTVALTKLFSNIYWKDEISRKLRSNFHNQDFEFQPRMSIFVFARKWQKMWTTKGSYFEFGKVHYDFIVMPINFGNLKAVVAFNSITKK